MKKVKINKIVFVGVSGGVDSSVSLAVLKEAGYKVVGVFIRTWTPDFIECTWKDERRDAMRVCAALDVPFLECDAEDAYKRGVADYMIREYKEGRTPNPDVMCNREVKFGVFWKFAKERGADFIATGHYAINEENIMKRSPDATKDQSYFLWTLTREDLSHTLFPIGHMKKSEVRILAKKFDLPTATKKDSQGVCFLGPLDMKDFLKHYINVRSGNVITEDGEVIGTHDGVLLYTLGERHGFTITKTTPNDKPFYIVAKDINNNNLIVANDKNLNKGNNENVTLNNVIIRGEIDINKMYSAQVRYHGEILKIKILKYVKNEMDIKFENPDGALASGQSVVIYDKDICLGGGVVK